MSANLQWHAIHTRPNCETKAISLLKKKGINYYCPRNKAVTADSKKIIETPLFPSIIFIQVPANYPLATFTSAQDGINLLYWKQAPAVFPDREIGVLSSFIESHETVEVIKTKPQPVHTGNEHAQQVTYSAEDKTFTLHLPSMGYQLVAKTATVTSVRVVRKDTPANKIKSSLGFILGTKN